MNQAGHRLWVPVSSKGCDWCNKCTQKVLQTAHLYGTTPGRRQRW